MLVIAQRPSWKVNTQFLW